MYQYIVSTEVIILYISVIIIHMLALLQSLAPVEKIADFFVTFLTGPFLVLTGSRLSFGGSVLPEIPFLLRRRV